MKVLVALLGMTLAVPMQARNKVDDGADAISKGVIMPMAESLHRRILEGQAKGTGPVAEAAKKQIEKLDVQASYAHDAEMLRRNQAIAEAKRCKVDCRPRPLMECMKSNYTVDDDVVGCSEGKIIKSW